MFFLNPYPVSLSKSRLGEKIIHYIKQANRHFHLFEKNDRILVCLSGGKDSWGLVWALDRMRKMRIIDISIHVLTLDQGQPGFNSSALEQRLTAMGISFEILYRNTYKIVQDKIPENQTYCSLCSRLRRGILYEYARSNGFNKIALGHHRDDLITSLLMSVFYKGSISSMPPKLLNEKGDVILLRPLCYVQEDDLKLFAQEQEFPIIPCSLCGSQSNLERQSIKNLIHNLAKHNPKIPSNILHALSNISARHLMDKNLFDFRSLQALSFCTPEEQSSLSHTKEEKEEFDEIFKFDT